GAWREDKTLYMMMELCETSLEGYWKMNNILVPEELHHAFVDSLIALHHLHSHSYIHLDVKPANILRTVNGIYKLTDFSVTVQTDKVSLIF
ncbi:hypothetical protein PFISCL1PPCAC_1237, partial [Pristionchus fissidentatus]